MEIINKVEAGKKRAYDVMPVIENGKTKTVMAAYHKGYDNVLEITVE